MGSNYPDGAWASDPNAPWNKPDAWEREECGTCRWLVGLGERHACLWAACNEREPELEERKPRDAACMNWECYLRS